MIKTKPIRRNARLTIEGGRGKYTQLGYRAVRTAVSEGRSYTRASGEAHEQYDRPKLVDQSRDFMRNNGLYRGMIERAVGYIYSDGFNLQVKSDDESLNRAVENKFKVWWEWPEVRHLLTGHEAGRMVIKELLTCGDTGALLTRLGLLQLFEAEQLIGKSGTGDGIKRNSVGRISSFFIAPYRNGYISPSGGQEYPAESVLYVARPERPSSLRGVPPCQSSFPMIHRINDVCDSEALAYQMLSRIAFAILRDEGSAMLYGESKEDDSKASSDLEGDLARRLVELDTALIYSGQPGDKIEAIERNIPGLNFSNSMYMFLRLLGLPLGLPLEIILLDWTKSNYSQSRAVLEQAQQTFLGWQLLTEAMFFRPLYRWLVARWVADGELPEKALDAGQEWLKPNFPWIDQLKEAQARGAMLDRGLETHTATMKSRNTDRNEQMDTRAKEVTDAIKRAQDIEKATGVLPPWQIFAGLMPPQVVNTDKPADKSDLPEPTPEGADDEK